MASTPEGPVSQYNIAEAKAQLSELTRRALAGEEVIIARGNTPLVRLIPVQAPRRARRPGSGKGQLLWMAPDFDAIPDGFEDYIHSIAAS
ncbi:type II toxin-antitoxin system Phd/YefM family antitoxin [uncultured Thiodictyon sp.]|uniref:type II toxin-antitoxin system Phd/YefM family antitoxin n=1 Tax=uncultured Thiodictyon sp. TaxID=1846217 RepID=UPI0025FA9B8F|nr:type II toxin-antitoxin system prevent-host-death family antitoxin [uncultured Thiodictyon sp.]